MKINKFYINRFRAFLGKPLLIKQKMVISLDSIDFCKDPIFILCCHRSGSSLLRRILNSHPNIACPPESQYLKHFFNLIDDDKSISGINGMVDKNDIIIEIRKLAFRFFENFRISENKGRWADKTPEYAEYYNSLKKLAPEQSKFIVLYRDPYDVFYSIYKRKWVIKKFDENLFLNSCKYVKFIMNKLLSIPNNESIVIRYENLVKNPKKVTSNICHFLNEEWSENMLKPWGSAHNFGTEDPISRSQKAFVISSENWQNLDEKQINLMKDELEDVRKKMGY